jgi:hypothetical protein
MGDERDTCGQGDGGIFGGPFGVTRTLRQGCEDPGGWLCSLLSGEDLLGVLYWVCLVPQPVTFGFQAL